MNITRDGFQGMIRRILKEEIEKQSNSSPDETIYNRLPEVVHDEDYRKITPHERDDRSKDELLDDIAKVVKEIDKDIAVGWDDHDDISINNTRDMFRIRIIPKWENNYCIEAFIRNEDRVYITGQTWKQVKEFVKKNLKKAETSVDKAWDKVGKNREEADATNDKGMPQKDKPKILPLTNEKPKTEKKKDKDYTEKQVKKENDLPEKPMQEVKGFKKQDEHKSTSPLTLRKEKTKFPSKNPNTRLATKDFHPS